MITSNETKIWNFLINKGYTPAGVAGIMGNLYAESGLIPNNLQNSFSNLGSDSYYTDSVNNKTYSKEEFVNDGAGYGLAQWTYYTRKRALYEYTIERGLSIADLIAQLEFLCKELEGYRSLNTLLKSTSDYKEASDAFLKDFEKPAFLNYNDRRDAAKLYYEKYTIKDTFKPEVKSEKVEGYENSKYETYEVQPNDSWWSIAANKLGSGTKMEELALLNGMSLNDIIHPGDYLYLPVIKANIPVDTNNIIDGKYINYIVQPNDSWWSIAANKMGDGTKMHQLAEFNNKTVNTMLHPNDILRIPCKNTPKYENYVVKPNDSWWSISAAKLGSGTKMNELARINKTTVKRILHVGEVIKLPK